MEFSTVLGQIVSGIFIILLSGLIGFLWKLTNTLFKIERVVSDFHKQINRFESKVELLDERVEIHDCFLTDLAGESVDTKRIAQGLDERLVFKCKKFKECP